MEFKLLSKAFKNGELIPDIYSNTRLGKNISPTLNWENPPEQTCNHCRRCGCSNCWHNFALDFIQYSL